ncbi:MAG: lysophospholipid acyltransferase family protein [Acidimicrobiia bacterium]
MATEGRSRHGDRGEHLWVVEEAADVVRPEPRVHVPEDVSDTDRWGRSEDVLRRVGPAFDFLYDRWFRTEIEGLDNVPAGGALLVSNHAGALPPDAIQIIWAIRRELDRSVYVLGENILSRLPVAGWIFRRIGGVEAAPSTARKLLGEEGRLGLVFPEGTKGTGKRWTERYRLQRFGRGGFVRVAMDAGVPIVPVAVLGAEEAMPIFGRLDGLANMIGVPYVPLTSLVWLPVKFRIRVLEPIDVHLGNSDDHTQQMVSEDVRSVIQNALIDLLGRRRSVILG